MPAPRTLALPPFAPPLVPPLVTILPPFILRMVPPLAIPIARLAAFPAAAAGPIARLAAFPAAAAGPIAALDITSKTLPALDGLSLLARRLGSFLPAIPAVAFGAGRAFGRKLESIDVSSGLALGRGLVSGATFLPFFIFFIVPPLAIFLIVPPLAFIVLLLRAAVFMGSVVSPSLSKSRKSGLPPAL